MKKLNERDADMIVSIEMWLHECEPQYVEKELAWLDELRTRLIEEEVPNDLEEAARHSEILTYPMPEDGDIEKVFKVQEARVFHEIGFIAGAKWRAEQLLKSSPLPEDTVLFNKGVEEGKRLMMEEWLKDRDGCFWDGVEEGKKAMEEKMLKGAVEIGTTDIYWEQDGDRAFPAFDPPVEDLLMPDIISQKFEDGQKVRIIIVKE